MGAWLREPLLHFLLLGAALFALDHVLNADEDQSRTIVVGAAVDAEAQRVFAEARGRKPDAAELRALHQVWLDNEVLYREGLALGVDKGDRAIRDRVIFKMLTIVEAGLSRPPIDDAQLRDYFERNRAKYDSPARIDFLEAVPTGDRSEPALRALAFTLNSAPAGDANAALRSFKGRPKDSLVLSYGEAFAHSLEESPPGEWRVIRATDAWRLVRLESVSPSKPADYEALRGIVLNDWIDSVMAEKRTAAVRALARKYTVRFEHPAS